MSVDIGARPGAESSAHTTVSIGENAMPVSGVGDLSEPSAALLAELFPGRFWAQAWPVAPGQDRGCMHCGSPRIHNDNPAQTWEHKGEVFALLRCEGCGGMYTFPSPSPQIIEWIYKEGFNYRWYADHYPAKFLDSLHRVVQYRSMGLLQGRGQRVLDYGGGVGYFSHAARVFGYTAETRDPMFEKTADGAATAQAPPARDYSVIACHHVLEHAIDPGHLLRDIRSRLAPDGRVILAVPNAGGRGYREQGTGWTWSQPPFIHIHHFTATGLRSLAERNGFVVQSEHFFERWDANTTADVKLVHLFRFWDGQWSRLRWKWGAAQRNSLRRFAALLVTQATSRDVPADRSELLVVLRPSADAANGSGDQRADRGTGQ